jgi:hypothetical protein
MGREAKTIIEPPRPPRKITTISIKSNSYSVTFLGLAVAR